MAELFNIQHETDLSEYDSTVTDGGDLSQAAGAALAGTAGGLQAVIDDTNGIYGQKNLTAPDTQIRFRFYVDPNGLTMADSTSFRFCVLNSSSSEILVCYMRYETANGHRLGVQTYHDAGVLSSLSQPVTDASHYVEVHIEKASTDSANDGRVRFWIDGTLINTWENVDLYNRFADMANIRLGAVSNIPATTSGTLYLDELKANDDGSEIGPVAAASAIAAIATSHYRRRRAA